MQRTLRGMCCLTLACAAALGVAACGGDDDGGGGGTSTGGAAATDDGASGGKTGGTIRTAYTSFPDYLDPALSYTQEGWQSLWTVYTPLLTYKHAEGAEGATVVPGLAEAMPEISADGKTYKLKLRSGLKYSDGTAVKASDFEHTIKRVLNLESGGSSFYQGIDGAEKYVKDGKAKADISGIVTDDATGDITINLDEPDGRFPYILTMDFAALVPGDTPFENQTKNPPPGVGPYKFENVAHQPRLRPREGRGLQRPRPGDRQARHDQGRGHQEPPPPDAGHDPEQDRLHERPAGARPAA